MGKKAKKNEPAWLLEWRLDAYKRWLTMKEPEWARVSYDKVDYNDIYYYAAPKRPAAMSLDEMQAGSVAGWFRPDRWSSRVVGTGYPGTPRSTSIGRNWSPT